MVNSREDHPTRLRAISVVLTLRLGAVLILLAGAVILSLRHAWLAVTFCLLLIVANLLLAFKWSRKINEFRQSRDF